MAKMGQEITVERVEAGKEFLSEDTWVFIHNFPQKARL